MTKIISIKSKGEVFEVLVDEDDYNRVRALNWNIQRDDSRRYVISTMHMGWNKKSTIRIHRLIMSFPENMVIDHINGNGLDNRKENLRACSGSDNSKNRAPIKGRALPRGVFMCKKSYRAAVKSSGKRHSLGSFASIKEASDAYESKAKELFGEFYNKGNL